LPKAYVLSPQINQRFGYRGQRLVFFLSVVFESIQCPNPACLATHDYKGDDLMVDETSTQV